MKYLAIFALACCVGSVSAQQPLSTGMAQLGADFQSLLSSEPYQKSIATNGALDPKLKAKEADLMDRMGALELSELKAHSALAEGDEYLVYTLRVQSLAETSYFSSIFLGASKEDADYYDPDMVLAATCGTFAGQSIKDVQFYGWHNPQMPQSRCLDVPEGASWSDVEKVYTRFLDAYSARLDAQLESMKHPG